MICARECAGGACLEARVCEEKLALNFEAKSGKDIHARRARIFPDFRIMLPQANCFDAAVYVGVWFWPPAVGIFV